MITSSKKKTSRTESVMTKERKQEIIDHWQCVIDNTWYTPLLAYPYCSICFERLTANNVTTTVEDGKDLLVEICIPCDEKEEINGK
jgi:hypothetical protein